jgi:hypothetical protein
MLTGVLQRVPDYVCDPSGTVHYDTIGVINGMKNLPSTLPPDRAWGRGSGSRPGRESERQRGPQRVNVASRPML